VFAIFAKNAVRPMPPHYFKW